MAGSRRNSKQTLVKDYYRKHTDTEHSVINSPFEFHRGVTDKRYHTKRMRLRHVSGWVCRERNAIFTDHWMAVAALNICANITRAEATQNFCTWSPASCRASLNEYLTRKTTIQEWVGMFHFTFMCECLASINSNLISLELQLSQEECGINYFFLNVAAKPGMCPSVFYSFIKSGLLSNRINAATTSFNLKGDPGNFFAVTSVSATSD